MNNPPVSPAGEAVSSRSRKWTIPRVLGLVTLIALLVVVALWWMSVCAVQQRLAAMRAQGLPTTTSEINAFYVVPEGIPDSTLAWVAAGKMAETAVASEAANTLPTIGKDCPDCEIPLPGEQWDKREAVAKFLSDNAALIESIRQAAAVGGQVRFPVNFRRGPSVDPVDAHRMRGISRILQLDSQASAHRGDGQRVLQNIHDLLTLSEALRGEPTILSQFIRQSVDTTAWSLIETLAPTLDWSDDELRGLQERLSAMTFERDMQRALAGETALFLDLLNLVPQGPFHSENQDLVLDVMGKLTEAFDHPWPESLQRQWAAILELQQRIGTSIFSKRHFVVSTVAPSLKEVGRGTARHVANQRLAIIALACLRHQHQHGAPPESLGKIDGQLLGELPNVQIDPFTGQPFLLRRDESGWLIYSAGLGGKDDQGHASLDVPFRVRFNHR